MEIAVRPRWIYVVSAVLTALICVTAGLVAQASWTDVLLYGVGGGVWLGVQLAGFTWWDAMVGFAEVCGEA